MSPDAREEETEEPQRIDTAKSDSFSLWPFLLFVSLLNIDEDEPDEEQDEDDLDSFFVQITGVAGRAGLPHRQQMAVTSGQAAPRSPPPRRARHR